MITNYNLRTAIGSDSKRVVAQLAVLHAIDGRFPRGGPLLPALSMRGECLQIDHEEIRRLAGDADSTQALVSLARDLWTGEERTSLHEILGLCDPNQHDMVVWALMCAFHRGEGGFTRDVILGVLGIFKDYPL
jgi:hypothetical protein